MTPPKLPTEAELDEYDLAFGTYPEASVSRLIALGREYYALRRKLREWCLHTRAAADCADPDRCDASDSSPQFQSGKACAYLTDAEEIEALLGEDK